MTVEAVGEAAAWSQAMAVKVEGERGGDSNGGGGAGRLGSRAWQWRHGTSDGGGDDVDATGVAAASKRAQGILAAWRRPSEYPPVRL
jgi:hypothetical protein